VQYRKLAAAVGRMREAACAGEWQLLPALDAECDVAVARLQALDVQDLSTLERARIVVLATRIRADQDEVQQLLRPRLQQLVRRMAALEGEAGPD
jgi:flagellar protein FliT